MACETDRALTYKRLAVPNDRFILHAETSMEFWSIKPKLDGEPASITHYLTDGRDFGDIIMDKSMLELAPDSYDAHRNASLRRLSTGRHGYADTQEDAVALVEVLRSGSVTGDVDAILADAYVKHCYDLKLHGKTVRKYQRKIGRCYFTFWISDIDVHLTFEKSGWTHWENLARFASASKRLDGKIIPIFWPDRVQANFRLLTVRACIAMMERYIADGRMSADRRRQAK
ncbi:hypothetical protein GCM10019059_36290 [Camelimonas fluminis]|uniref:Uncharacterized protein n=1 Tax=Camelimonas fluminis TaxID=1576911 RepID=A0ABV7UBP2_9HYPH|nr:hypothetical protein [Camelimonas fluminis]GHE73500.1 hypothetical protein GCM10019059_36290 [Camelimonas fluminis]